MFNELIKHEDDWLDEWIENALQKPDKGGHIVSNRNFVNTCAVSLGDHLAEYHHSSC